MTPQAMFEKFNRKYFGGRLPDYRVVVSRKYGGHGLCRKDQREIHLNSGLRGRLLERVLLHEMCHAAAHVGHGRKWQAEMLRIAELEAPVKREVCDYQNPDKREGMVAILAQFEDFGFEMSDVRWSEARLRIGYSYSLVDENGRSESRQSAKILLKCRKSFNAGRRERSVLTVSRRRRALKLTPLRVTMPAAAQKDSVQTTQPIRACP